MITQKSLTKKQHNILNFIKEFIQDRGYAPSYREIAHQFKLSSVATVHAYIRTLQEKKYIYVEENESRSIRLVNTINNTMAEAEITELPLAGLITAGEPIEAVEDNETINVPSSMLGNKNYFALKVKGESMIEDGILDGDYIIAEQKQEANNGDIVVALLDKKYATLKRFYKEKDHIRLQPANSLMEPIRVKHAEIQGKLIGLIRKYS
jgi:repressor LexA